MRRREHRLHIVLCIFRGMIGAMCLAMGGVFVSGVLVTTGGIVVALSLVIFMLAGGSFMIIVAFRPDVLTVDDTGLHLRQAFRTRHIPWDAVHAFRVVSAGKGTWPQAILRTKKLTMFISDGGPGAEKVVAELTEALREHTDSAEPPR